MFWSIPASWIVHCEKNYHLWSCCLLVNSSLLFAFSDYESDYEDDYGCGYDSGYMHDCDYSDPIGLSYSDNVVGETNVCSAQSEKYWCD